MGDAIQPSHGLMPSSPSALNLSQHQGLFQWVSCLHQTLYIWGLSFSISPSSEYSGLISLKIDWFELRVVQGTLRSLFQHHNSKASASSLGHLLSAYPVPHLICPSVLLPRKIFFKQFFSSPLPFLSWDSKHMNLDLLLSHRFLRLGYFSSRILYCLGWRMSTDLSSSSLLPLSSPFCCSVYPMSLLLWFLYFSVLTFPSGCSL